MPSEKPQRLLTIREAAEFLGRGQNTMYIDVRAGRIPYLKVGKSIRFDLDELRQWLQENRPAVNGKAGG